MKYPKLSVVMPVLNGERYIRAAIKSILNQTFQNFELIIVNDGSTDRTEELIRQFKDTRIKIINNKKNLGLAKAINKGVFSSIGKYIARCDADDINRKDRFEKQIKFLEKNPEFVLVGSEAEGINEKGQSIEDIKLKKSLKVPETDIEIKENLIIRNCIIHPSVMYLAKIVKEIGGYRNFFNGGAEEYDLWFRLLKYGKFHNIQENLIKRRFHNQVFTKKYHWRVEFLALIVRIINLPNLVIGRK